MCNSIFKSILIVTLIMIFQGVQSQLPAFFLEENWRLNDRYASVYAVAIGDVNGDYRDDLILSSSDSTYFLFQLEEGEIYGEWSVVPTGFPPLTVNLGDLDENGYNEVILAGNNSGVLVIQYDEESQSMKLEQQIASLFYAQGSSMTDYDSDGDIDFFASNDVSYNKLFENDDTGILNEVEIDDFNILESSGASGNYNAIWFDPDGDGDQDLYIAKCHVNAQTFEDPRRINQFFLNENGQFVEQAEAFNLAQGDQSWCSVAADFDNDGDQDIALLNHGTPFAMLENRWPLPFAKHEDWVDNKPLLGDDQQFITGDFNNDGFEDIFLTGFDDQLLINQGNLRFTSYPFVLGTGNAYSAATGDFNNDGWLDLYAIYGVEASSVPDRVWLNLAMSNNWLKLSLNGIQSNSMALGTMVRCHTGGNIYTRWLRSGESYGISNSLNVHFGLEKNSVIDSIVCYWPSGIVETFRQLDVNKHYVITENVCIEELSRIEMSADNFDCDNQEIILSAGDIESAIWNHSVVSEDYVVNQSGLYFAKSTSECKNATEYVIIDEPPPAVQPVIFNEGEVILCNGDSYTLIAQDNEVQWSDGTIGIETELTSAGTYFAFDDYLCDTLFSSFVNIEFIDFENADIELTVDSVGVYEIESQNENTKWYDQDFNLISEGRLLELVVESDTQFYFQYEAETLSPPLALGPDVEEERYVQHGASENYDLIFSAEERIMLFSVSCRADVAGQRLLVIKNMDEETVYEQTYDMQIGHNVLHIDQVLLPGFYSISFDESYNQTQFGENSPSISYYTPRSDELVLGHLIEIDPDLQSRADGMYFYNWEASVHYEDCKSEFNRYVIDLDTIVAVEELSESEVVVQPNPSSGLFEIVSSVPFNTCDVYDIHGRKVHSIVLPMGTLKHSLDCAHLQKGQYYLFLAGESRSGVLRIVKL